MPIRKPPPRRKPRSRQGPACCHMLSVMDAQRHCISCSFAVALLSSNPTKKSLIRSRRFLRRRRGGNFRVVSKEKIFTRHLDEIEECPQADFIKLDVQGAELLVLENALQKISNAVVIETEVEFVEIYRNQPLFGDIQKFMRDQGFVLHKLVDISGRNFRPMSTGDPTHTPRWWSASGPSDSNETRSMSATGRHSVIP